MYLDNITRDGPLIRKGLAPLLDHSNALCDDVMHHMGRYLAAVKAHDKNHPLTSESLYQAGEI